MANSDNFSSNFHRAFYVLIFKKLYAFKVSIFLWRTNITLYWFFYGLAYLGDSYDCCTLAAFNPLVCQQFFQKPQYSMAGIVGICYISNSFCRSLADCILCISFNRAISIF